MTTIDIGMTQFDGPVSLRLDKANRHGLVTGATGTGKTVTLQRLAEQFSAAGVPVFAADIKGDLSGVAAMGDPDGKAAQRARDLGQKFRADKFPVAFWDLFGRHGSPIRTSVQEMGKEMVSAMMSLTPVQDGTLGIAFRKAEDDQDYMLSLDDLRWSLNDMAEDRETICKRYGNVTAASIAAIQRCILAIEDQGGAELFGEPPFDILDLMRSVDGRGVINLLHADTLVESPKLYAMFLLWLMSALFKALPEAGDVEKPKLVFFFDEAHLLFQDAPKALMQTIERLVRLVRSKGVGVFFVTQSPKDVPDSVLAQLGNRIQHALRAYTPKDRKAVKAAADAFRPNPDLDIKGEITSLGVGEAFVSVLDADGKPTVTQLVKILPPSAQIGPVSTIEREPLHDACPMRKRYQHVSDATQQAYQFMRRMKQQRGIDPGPDTGPTEWREGDYIHYVPAHIGVDEGAIPARSRLSYAVSAVMWAGVAVICAFGAGWL